MTNSIEVVLHSFKNKKLKDVVDSIIDTASSKVTLRVIDQNPTDRSKSYLSYDQVSYKYVSWDSIRATTSYRDEAIRTTESDFLLFISDDVLLPKDWDKTLVEIAEDSVISGTGIVKIEHKNKFFIKAIRHQSNTTQITQYIDRNFIFAKTETLKDINYPERVKYFGEEELLSLALFISGIDIYSLPSNFYIDLQNRLFENMYSVMSLEHGYNSVVDAIRRDDATNYLIKNRRRSRKEFLDLHNIDDQLINKLPFEKSDVSYDPENVKFLKTTPKKFVDTTKVIS
jgi:hypothetical protein